MKLCLSLILPLLASAKKVHIKRIENPFIDDPSIVILSPEHHGDKLGRRHLQNSNNDKESNDFFESLDSCPENSATWALTVRTDDNPSETKWTLKQVLTNDLALSGPPPNAQYMAGSSYYAETCILKGYKYLLRILDSGGDGMCCQSGSGGFTMSVDGDVFIDHDERDEDWSRKSFMFHVGNLTMPLETPNPTSSKPTRRPNTRRPTAKPTLWEAPPTTPQPTEQEMIMLTQEPQITLDLTTPSPTDPNIITLVPTDPEVVTPNPTPEPTPESTPEPEVGVAVSFVMMGDVPYSTNHKYCLNKQLRELNPAEMEHPYSFIVHVGDIKSGQTRDCVNEYYSDVADIFASPLNNFYYDTRDCFFLIGDNDWCDCNDPGSSFTYWMNNFGNGNKYNWINQGMNPNGFGTFSNRNMRRTLEYDYDGWDQDLQYYPSSASNFAFFIDKVLFVGINQVGGGEIGDESTRVRNNFQWVKSKMEQYAEQDMKTLIVLAHAPMSWARWEYFGMPFQALLRDSYPDILVIYAHGDGHEFNLDRIDRYNPNLYQLECDSGDLGDPLLISIIRTGSGRDGLNVDRRGGTYINGDCDPDNRDKTWNSNLF